MPSLLEVALGEIERAEAPGDSADNPEILKYHEGLSFPKKDSVPWCSIFIRWCALRAGLTTIPPKSKVGLARSWLSVGLDVAADPRPGDLVIFTRPGSPTNGHVAIFCRQDEAGVWCLGGNQSDRVCIARYPRDRVLGYRRLS